MSTPSPYPNLTPSPGVIPKSILHKQTPPQVHSMDRSNSIPSRRPTTIASTSTISNKKLDLIHDDWFGLAPLASPESLSEISSISSRASNALSLAASIEKCLQRISTNGEELLELDESQMQTPKILRRTPKITGNLSTCADDWRSVDSYKRMGKIFMTNPLVPSTSNNNSDSSELSFETASSLDRTKCCTEIISTQQQSQKFLSESSRSADNLDGDENNDNLTGVAKTLTNSDSRILNECSSSCPNCPCRTNSYSYCCRLFDHTNCVQYNKSLYFNNNLIQQIVNTAGTNSSSGDTYHSALSSLTGGFDSINSNGSVNKTNENNFIIDEQLSTINPVTGVLESHFPAYRIDDKLSLLTSTSSSLSNESPKFYTKNRNNNSGMVKFSSNIDNNSNSDIGYFRKRNNSGDRIFAKNESLPLLANLSEKSSPTNFVKRKRNIYPMHIPLRTTAIKGESNV